jgi:hypothetical protein
MQLEICFYLAEQAWDLWDSIAREITVGDLCSLCIYTTGTVDRVIATGKVIKVELPDFALIEIQKLVEYEIDCPLHYIMRAKLKPGLQVKWFIQYLFPVQEAENKLSCDGSSKVQVRTFLTPIAKQRPGIAKKDQKLKPYRNIIVNYLWNLEST